MTALWKDIRFTSERHLRYIVGGQKKKNNNYNFIKYPMDGLAGASKANTKYDGKKKKKSCF